VPLLKQNGIVLLHGLINVSQKLQYRNRLFRERERERERENKHNYTPVARPQH